MYLREHVQGSNARAGGQEAAPEQAQAQKAGPLLDSQQQAPNGRCKGCGHPCRDKKDFIAAMSSSECCSLPLISTTGLLSAQRLFSPPLHRQTLLRCRNTVHLRSIASLPQLSLQRKDVHRHGKCILEAWWGLRTGEKQ